ncbi:hypothetical protein MHU86_4208 [Fragilaria crotonensis]|nr:hypothetical protein MHU86_4208 [Fragilaria crotonensis]
MSSRPCLIRSPAVTPRFLPVPWFRSLSRSFREIPTTFGCTLILSAPFQCPIDPRSNLPVALAKTPCNPGGCIALESSTPESPGPPCASCQRHSLVSLSVLDETNQNITAAQKDLLLWHFRLGHLGFSHLQHLMRPRTIEDLRSKIKSEKPIVIDPCIVPKNPSTRTCKPPLCASCQIARAKRRPTDVSTTVVHQESILKEENLAPGSRVSIDQYESAVSLRTADTLVSKRAFERSAKSCGVKIKSYHGDNGVFKAKEFTDSITQSDQELQFSGVGAHHQNGVAERAIRTVTEKARTMMQHSFIHWPDEFQVQLWPFALDYACWLHNHTPHNSHGWAPLELFCGTQVDCQHLQRARVWGVLLMFSAQLYKMARKFRNGHQERVVANFLVSARLTLP